MKIRRLNSKYKEFSEAAGLPMQKERMKVTYTDDASIAKAAVKKAASTPQTLANSGRYGIMNTIGKEPIAITDEAIEKVPLVKPSGWSDEQAKNLQSAHKELLQYAKTEPIGTECGFLIDKSGSVVLRKTGELLSVRMPDISSEHMLVHNHPNNETFSRSDIESFLWRENMYGVTAIGNDGFTVHGMFKTDRYDGMNALDTYLGYRDRLLKIEEQKTDLEAYFNLIDKLMEDFKHHGIEVI